MKTIFSRRNIFVLVFIFLLYILEILEIIYIRKVIADQYLAFYAFFNQNAYSTTHSPITRVPTKNIRDLLRQLKAELVVNKYLVNQLKQLKQENQKLKNRLQEIESHEQKVIPANIVLLDPQNHFISLWIDQGENQGVVLHQPVIGYQNGIPSLIGFISEVQNNFSLVKTIMDQQTHVGIKIGDTGSRAISKGQSKFNPYLKVDYIERNLQDLKGKNIYTSGIGGRYPEGILIGTITQVLKKNYGLFQSALMKPAINFFTVENVLVILTDSEKSEAPEPSE